jgi:RecA-family ATPase
MDYYDPDLIQLAQQVMHLPQPDYPVTDFDPNEVAYKEYEHERWNEDETSWAPLINLEQLERRPNLEVEWYCPDWIPVGAKTILSAEPKTGKTILLFHILKAVTEGGEFLGKPCPPTRVLYLTEQTEQEFKKQICEVKGLIGNKNFYVLLAEETPPTLRTWEDTLEFSERMLSLTKAKILVVDTFGGLAKLPPNGENDAATIQNNINKLNFLFKNRYLSVVLTHHNRKRNEDKRDGGNLTINSARGSSAFVGGGGHLIFMDSKDVKTTERQFSFYGRYLHGQEKTLYLSDDGYHEEKLRFPKRGY